MVNVSVATRCPLMNTPNDPESMAKAAGFSLSFLSPRGAAPEAKHVIRMKIETATGNAREAAKNCKHAFGTTRACSVSGRWDFTRLLLFLRACRFCSVLAFLRFRLQSQLLPAGQSES